MDANKLKEIIEKHKIWRESLGEKGEGADLTGADLYGADLTGADLTDADLTRANLYGADLTDADLTRAKLTGAKLTRADLTRAKYLYYSHIPEEGSFIGYKKVRSFGNGDTILKIEIPTSAKRTSSIVGRKNRADKVKVLAWLDGEKWNKKAPDFKMFSSRDNNFIYEIGKIISVDNFNDDPRIECAPGIHFFIMLQEAKDYSL